MSYSHSISLSLCIALCFRTTEIKKLEGFTNQMKKYAKLLLLCFQEDSWIWNNWQNDEQKHQHIVTASAEAQATAEFYVIHLVIILNVLNYSVQLLNLEFGTEHDFNNETHFARLFTQGTGLWLAFSKCIWQFKAWGNLFGLLSCPGRTRRHRSLNWTFISH